MKEFSLAFIPLFVAVDALGAIPIFVSLTQGMEDGLRWRVIVQSVVTALLVATGFIFLGKGIFHLLGITMSDFMIAGGALLFIIAISDLASSEKQPQKRPATLGAVPLGTPLLSGPAVLSTALMLTDVYGIVPTLSACVVNLVLAGIVFAASGYITKLLGKSGSQAISKVTSLLLAAIAIMLMRRGMVGLISSLKGG